MRRDKCPESRRTGGTTAPALRRDNLADAKAFGLFLDAAGQRPTQRGGRRAHAKQRDGCCARRVSLSGATQSRRRSPVDVHHRISKLLASWIESRRLLNGHLEASDDGARVLQRLLVFALFLVRRLRVCKARKPLCPKPSKQLTGLETRCVGTWLMAYLSGILRRRLELARDSSPDML